MKKISVLLVFVLLLSLAASFGVSAETKVISSGVCGDNLTWILYEGEGPGHDRTFVIEGTGDMYDYEFSYFGKEEGSTPEQIPCPWEEETQSIDELVFKGNITKIGSGTFTYTLGGGSSLSKIVIPDGVKSIGEGAFADCRSLSEVIMPNSLESIGAFAFSGCSNLENIIIPDSVTSVGRDAFAGSGLSNVTFSDSIKKIADSMFRDCRMIKDMVIPEGITEIGANAFAGSGLSSVTIPDSVTKIDAYAFKGCRELKHIIIPDSVTSIGDGAFSEYVSGSHECGLRSIVIPESVTDLGDNMFTGATYLVKAEINANITEIPFGLFIWCHKLEDVTLPENITKIGAYAFSNCGSLKSITIPGSVKEIDYNAFHHCKELTDVYFGGTEQEWKKIKIGSYNYDLLDANIHFNEAPVKDDTIGVIVYGSKVKFDQEPFIEDGRTLVPLRAIFEALGATVEWDEKTSTVTANKDGVEIELQIGSNEMKVGDEVKILDVPAKISGGRTMVPVRAISEAFGCKVEWDGETRNVTVSGNDGVV